jgi:hypothetical protein
MLAGDNDWTGEPFRYGGYRFRCDQPSIHNTWTSLSGAPSLVPLQRQKQSGNRSEPGIDGTG